MFLERFAEPLLKRYLRSFPAVGLTGPRQSGKSTLLRNALPNYQYVTFDDQRNIELFEEDSEAFLAQFPDKVIFDEAQYVPEIFNAIKIRIDNDRQNYGKYVLTGSSQFSFVKNITESLAGRIGLMQLLPLQFSEMPKALQEESIYQGAYPELVLRDYRDADLWYSSYLDTYLNKDVRVLSQIGDMRDFRRLINLAAANVGQALDMSNFAKDLGVSVPTIKRWISILEASYVLFLLPPFSNNLGKRIVKSPKLYFYDTGLVSYLTGIKTFSQYNQGPLAGSLFENYIIAEVKKKLLHGGVQAELCYFRTQDKAEIDLIIDHRSHQEFIEIKKSATFRSKMASSLKSYSGENQAYLVYQGESMPYRANINVINYREFLESNPVNEA
jgi:predicted AAA+ superfamily ATPase